MITNIDIVTPIHDDAYIMGEIATCNATNDLFALNAIDVISYNCFLALPTDIPEEISVNILKGTKNFLESIGGRLNGGHTIQNDVPLMGGAASAILEKKYLIPKQGVKDGDKLILTKPLGIQTIMAADRAMKRDSSHLEGFDVDQIRKGVSMAEKIMTTSNQPIPRLIHKHKVYDCVHAMTDVTGFGFKRHLEEMLINSRCGAFIDRLPTIHYSPVLEDLFCYGIEEGESSEIAGAMLLSIDGESYKDFTQKMTDEKVWWKEVGRVSKTVESVKYSDQFYLENIEDYR